jgi:hypothetical protein
MKLIALKDFRNVPSLELEIKDALHPSHIHKGATFEIGKAAALKDCSKTDQQLIAQLIVSSSVGDATDENVVKAVKAEVDADEKREKAAAKLNSAANDSALVQQLIAQLKGGKAA